MSAKMASAGKKEDRNESSGGIVYHAAPEAHKETALSTAILLALDSIPGYDIEDSETVVYDHIDLDALDELFSPTGGTPRSGEVTFDVEQYEVTATAAGEITIKTKSTD